MDIKFSKVAKASLSSVPIVNGQIIVLTDSDEIYYDMNSTRRRASYRYRISNYTFTSLYFKDKFFILFWQGNCICAYGIANILSL